MFGVGEENQKNCERAMKNFILESLALGLPYEKVRGGGDLEGRARRGIREEGEGGVVGSCWGEGREQKREPKRAGREQGRSREGAGRELTGSKEGSQGGAGREHAKGAGAKEQREEGKRN
jgi:hypothetical protein